MFSSLFILSFYVAAGAKAAETENDAAHAAQNLRLGGTLPPLEFSDEGATDFTIVTASMTSRAASANAIGTADTPIEVDEEDVVPIPVTVDTVEHGNTNPLFPGDFYFPGLEEDFLKGRLDVTEEETPIVIHDEDYPPVDSPAVRVKDSKRAALDTVIEPRSKKRQVKVVPEEDSYPAAKRAVNLRSKKRKTKVPLTRRWTMNIPSQQPRVVSPIYSRRLMMFLKGSWDCHI
jgi:hypothetical protein